MPTVTVGLADRVKSVCVCDETKAGAQDCKAMQLYDRTAPGGLAMEMASSLCCVFITTRIGQSLRIGPAHDLT